ncbi:hypothetical protein K530_51070 [Streptomyces noursei CCRC 11814]|nr:hypothetical protein K530_51070 [Streptomyces noursei CCRC 11814]
MRIRQGPVAQRVRQPGQVDADVPATTAILRQGLDAWLSELKAAAEARTTHQPS